MSDKVRKIINFRFDKYYETEIKLEKMAAKGLILEKCSSLLWTFKKEEPKQLKYTVTYFSEGSIFNPDITDNQQTYIEYAKAAGWDFVTEFNQMQIFSSEEENPIPFETDEEEKLENIKKCMKKGFVGPVCFLILVVMFNFCTQFYSLFLRPIDYLSDYIRVIPICINFMLIIFEIGTLLDYYIWCRQSKKSIESGNRCIEKNGKAGKIIGNIFVSVMVIILAYLLLYIADFNFLGVFLCIAPLVISVLAFSASTKYLKNKKVSAMKNKVFSGIILAAVSSVCVGFVVFAVTIGMEISGGEENYKAISWKVSEIESYEYRKYSEDIPLKCEDLYGDTGYEYYSYEKEVNSTIFLTKSNYFQGTPPEKNAPPELSYEILEPKFDFVYKEVKKEVKTIPSWRENISLVSIDNEMFKTIEAYEEYDQGEETGRYTLFYEDKIVTLKMENPATDTQISVIIEKLGL